MMMKLFHRTSFWGTDLQGYRARGHKLPIIQVQVIMGEECSSSFGCCPHHGRRCVVIDESHFIATSREDWNLYHVRTVLGEASDTGDFFHDFALIPKPQATKNNIGSGWSLLGTVQPCAARMDLAPLLRPFFANNNNVKYMYAKQHVHINLAMNCVTVDVGRHHERAPARERRHVTNGKMKQEDSIPVVDDSRWQQPTQGMPFYSRNNTAPNEQEQVNGTLKKQAQPK